MKKILKHHTVLRKIAMVISWGQKEDRSQTRWTRSETNRAQKNWIKTLQMWGHWRSEKIIRQQKRMWSQMSLSWWKMYSLKRQIFLIIILDMLAVAVRTIHLPTKNKKCSYEQFVQSRQFCFQFWQENTEIRLKRCSRQQRHGKLWWLTFQEKKA